MSSRSVAYTKHKTPQTNMQKTFVSILLLGSVVVAAFAQGTVGFSNSGLTRVSFANGQFWPTTPGLINYGLLYGIGQSTSLTLNTLTLGVNSTSVAGVIASPIDNKSSITALQIPETIPGETDVWVRVAGWSSEYGTDWQTAQSRAAAGLGWFGETSVINALALGPSTGPGAQIWQSPTGTDPHKFAGGFILTTLPEPGTFALANLGAAVLMIFHRRK
jgi:hypothetical protein